MERKVNNRVHTMEESVSSPYLGQSQHLSNITGLLLAELSQPTGWLRPCLSQQHHNYKAALSGVSLRTLMPNLIRLFCPPSTPVLTWPPQQKNKSSCKQETLVQSRGQRAAHQGCSFQSQRRCILQANYIWF